MPEFSEFHITKVSDASTPLLFSGDAFVFDGTKAGGDVQPYMEWKLKEVLISGVIENGDTAVDPNNPNVDLSASGDDGGFVIYGFPTETIRPTESLDDGEYLLTSIQHSATDTSLVDQTDTEASSRLFVGNLTLDSQASVDDGPDLLVGSSGSDWF